MRGAELPTASRRFGVAGLSRMYTLPLPYFNDGTRIWNSDAAEGAGS